eukprot:6487606-Pyramimonas_sp.AAC.1
MDHTFQEVPSELLSHQLWRDAGQGTWRYSRHIGTLEFRAPVVSQNRMALAEFGFTVKHIMLVGNLAVALAFDRCRCRSVAISRQIRKFTAYLLSKKLRAIARWIPSDLDNGSEGSRAE